MESANTHGLQGWLFDYFEVFNATITIILRFVILSKYSILAYIALSKNIALQEACC